LLRGIFRASEDHLHKDHDIHDPLAIYRALLKAQSANHELFLWQESAEHFYKFPTKIIKVDREGHQLKLKIALEYIGMVEQLWGLDNVSFYLPNGSFYLKLIFKRITPNGELLTTFPQEMIFFDRRSAPRFHPEKLIKIEFKSTSFKTHKNCYDFSRGGFSVIYTKSEQSAFELGQKISQLKITYDDLVVTCSAVVQELTPIKPFVFENIPYGYKKVSFRFVELNQDQKQKIASIIGHHLGIFRVS